MEEMVPLDENISKFGTFHFVPPQVSRPCLEAGVLQSLWIPWCGREIRSTCNPYTDLYRTSAGQNGLPNRKSSYLEYSQP